MENGENLGYLLLPVHRSEFSPRGKSKSREWVITKKARSIRGKNYFYATIHGLNWEAD
jgi:hypothetical protein